ncbi:hypothetical protein JCM31598_15370 [Desulfonatronum parangueonense]
MDSTLEYCPVFGDFISAYVIGCNPVDDIQFKVEKEGNYSAHVLSAVIGIGVGSESVQKHGMPLYMASDTDPDTESDSEPNSATALGC